MSFITAIAAALAPWVRAFSEAMLPFLKQQAIAPVDRTVAEKDGAIEEEVGDAIDQYDSDPRASAD